MARTTDILTLPPAPGSRPTGLFNKVLQFRAKFPYEQRFTSEIGNSHIWVEQIDENTVVLLTDGFLDALDPDSGPPLERYTDEDHMFNRGAGTDEYRAWKTTRVYEVIGNHPRLVQFRGRDPWTALPTWEKPSATLAGFLEGHQSTMYAPISESGNGNANADNKNCHLLYLKGPYRPLIFQWALQLLTGLIFIHSKDVILGDLHIYTCWLQPPPNHSSISIFGFLDAVYMVPKQGQKVHQQVDLGS
ncbi:hypothetical protein BJY01DRAFT_248658 [Aspergillus pseudoustus]|uniref:Protein kinase domain-containing protein n=1 Tax=Aspergillus pseudoustus TaxID=1810923 RepID=A0ABR4JTJ2_9EURO